MAVNSKVRRRVPAKKKVLPSGRSPLAETAHKLRGIVQILIDMEHLYPKRIKVVAWSIPLAVILLFGWRYYATQNHRLLTGPSLLTGHFAFDAIRDADALSEDLKSDLARRKAVAEAETQVSMLQQQSKTPEELRASTVMSFYLDEVRKITVVDLECADAMQRAQSTQVQNAAGLATKDQLNVAELGELKCITTRSQAIGIKNVCRDEALSYLFPNRQPPVDQCMFRHQSQGNSQN